MHEDLFKRSALRARSKVFWAGLLRACGILFLAKRWVRRRGAVVLTFHRVLTDADLPHTASLPGMVVREKTFESFLNYAAQTCEFVDLSREPDRRTNSRLKLGVTFDDGWSDNASIAYPIARKYQTPMVIFIVTEKMGSALPFWPEQAASVLEQGLSAAHHQQGASYLELAIKNLKELPAEERNQRIGLLVAERTAPPCFPPIDTTLTWEQIAQLQRDHVSFGSHTMTHEILTTIPLAAAEKEIAGSRERMEQKLGTPCHLFAYPNGDFSEEVRELVQRAGYKFAFLNQDPGVWTPECNPYLIPRVNVCEYHLVDAKGSFSQLIFDYAVIWSAAKGLMAQKWSRLFQKLSCKWKGVFTRLGATSGKNRMEKQS